MIGRRAPRLVAWGGRPGIDVQIGSERDRARYAAQRLLAGYRRAYRDVAVHFAAIGAEATRAMAAQSHAAAKLGIPTRDVVIALEQNREAMWRASHPLHPFLDPDGGRDA